MPPAHYDLRKMWVSRRNADRLNVLLAMVLGTMLLMGILLTRYGGPKTQQVGVAMVLFMMLGVAAISSVAFWNEGVRRSRRGAVCKSCGYSLKGLDEDAACPECGAVSGRKA
jgi:hypothetical protein